MEEKVNFALVGVFVLALGAALIAGVLWLSSGGAYRRAYDTYQTYMDESVSGLSRDAPVRYRGVEVGRVRRMALASAHVEQVQLTLDIERGTPVKQDTVAVLRVQGLTGIAYVELSGGSSASPELVARPGEAYPVIRSGPSLMVRLDSAITTLLTNLNRGSESLVALLDEGSRRDFKQTLADLRILSRTLAARSATIDTGLSNAARTLENSARFSDDLPRLVERMQKSADGFDRMSSELARAGQSASAAMADANATLTGAGNTLAGARADLREAGAEIVPEMQLLLAELREVTASLRRISQQVEQNPRLLLFGKPAPGPGPGE
ncbi:MAG: MCE family protein [Burkholderiales bacterium]|nr:MCE family protein [Burkholderiales bacterium]